jgi:hypothetical protein
MSKLKHVQLYENFQEGTPGGYRWISYNDEDISALGLVSNSDFERLVKENQDQGMRSKDKYGHSKYYYGYIPQVRPVEVQSDWVYFDHNGEFVNIPQGDEESYGIGPNGFDPWNPNAQKKEIYQVWHTSEIEPGTMVIKTERHIPGTFTVDEFISKYLNGYR